jgi:hypothetical protein
VSSCRFRTRRAPLDGELDADVAPLRAGRVAGVHGPEVGRIDREVGFLRQFPGGDDGERLVVFGVPPGITHAPAAGRSRRRIQQTRFPSTTATEAAMFGEWYTERSQPGQR